MIKRFQEYIHENIVNLELPIDPSDDTTLIKQEAHKKINSALTQLDKAIEGLSTAKEILTEIKELNNKTIDEALENIQSYRATLENVLTQN